MLLPQLSPARHALPGNGRRMLVWPLAVAATFLLWQVAMAPAASLYPDSYRYTEMIYRFLGQDRETAHASAVTLVCADRAEQAARWNAAQVSPDPNASSWTVAADCAAENADHFIPTGADRYQAIFSSRPGYPLAAAALAPLTGVRFALWAVPVGSVLLAGLGVWWVLRQLQVGSVVAAGGQAALYLLPVGTWGVQALSEGPVLLGVVAAMAGGVALLQGRRGVGAGLLLAGLLVTGLVKYSSALMLCAALAAAGVGALVVRGGDRAGGVLLGGIGAAGVGSVLALTAALELPTAADTLQDTFTDHYRLPDVADPWVQLLAANLRYWERWPILVPSNLALLAGGVVGGWALWRRHRGAALVVLACAAVGIGQAVAHPEVNALDRLYVLAWLATVVGVPVAVGGPSGSLALDSSPAVLPPRRPSQVVREGTTVFCRHCGKPIQRTPDGGWTHSSPLREGCAYPADTVAEPAERERAR